MAKWESVTGFEAGSLACWNVSGTAPAVAGASARSGSYGARSNPAATTSGANIPAPNNGTTWTFAAGSVFGQYAEFLFKIVSLPSGANQSIGGMFSTGGGNGITIQVSNTGAWRVVVSGLGNITAGLSNLPTDTWLRAIVRWWSFPGTTVYDEFGTSGSPTDAQRARVTIWSEDGSTTSYGDGIITGANLGVSSIATGAKIGCLVPDTGTYDIRYDDVKCMAAFTQSDCDSHSKWLTSTPGTFGAFKHKLNQAASIFTNTRVYVLLPASQGAFNQFSPAGFDKIDEVPQDGTAGDEVTNSTNGQSTSVKPTQLQSTQQVEAIAVRANVRSSASNNTNCLLYDNVEFNRQMDSGTSADDGTTPYLAAFYSPYELGSVINNREFGVRNKTGNTLTLENLFMEALASEPSAVEVEFSSGDVTIGLTWVERQDSNLVVHVSAKIALPDPLTYFFGFKKDTIIKWGSIRRALSDRNGQYEGTDFSWIESDTDRFIRAQLAADSTKYFVNRPFTVRMISDADRRLQLLPRTVVKGIIREYRPLSPLHFEFTGQDILAQKFSPQNDKDQIPQRTIQVADFPDADGEHIVPPDTLARKVDAVGKPVPIVYGDVNNRSIVDVTTQVGGGGGNYHLETDPNLPNAGNYGGNANGLLGASTFAQNQGIRYAYTVIKDGKEGPMTVISGTMVMENPSFSHTAFSFDQIPGVDSYRVYMFDGIFNSNDNTNIGNTFVRFKTHDNVTVDGFFGHQFGVEFFGPTDGLGYFEGPTSPPTYETHSEDHGTGQVGVTYCGQELHGGVNSHVFLICGHAVKSVDELYVDKVALGLATTRGNWKVPGYDAEPKFEDRHSHRYAIVYGAVGFEQPDLCAADPTKLALAVKGIEATGDGTGALITSLLLQYKHAVINWILQSYETGAWLTAPVFPDDVALSQIDETTFDAADAISIERIAGGYVGAFIIGANQERLTIRDQVALFNVNADVDSGFNRKTQFMVSMVSDAIAQVTAAESMTDQLDIFSGSFDIEDRVYELFNRYEAQYAKNYTAGSGDKSWLGDLTGDNAIKDDLSIEKYEEIKNAPVVTLAMIRSTAIAQDVVMRKLLRTKNPPRMVKMRTGLRGVNFELGEILKVTHYEGIGSSGWSARPVRIMRHETEPDDYSVSLECLDMQGVFGSAADGGGPYILGDEGVLTNWGAATLAQKVYGFLCDDTTGKFSDGKEGKHLR